MAVDAEALEPQGQCAKGDRQEHLCDREQSMVKDYTQAKWVGGG